MRLAFLTGLLVIGGTTTAHAQAYLDEPNSLLTNIGYTYAPSGKVIAEPGGIEVPSVDVMAHLIIPQIQYVTPIAGLAVEGEVPLMVIRAGDDNFDHFPENGEFDDGDYHFTTVDIKAGARYQIKAVEQYLGLSFSAGALIPTDYPVQGLTAPGQKLFGGYVGISMAGTIDPVWENLFFQADYTLTLRQRLDTDEATRSKNRDYSEPSFFLGAFLPKGFVARVGASSRFSHGGVEFNTILFEPREVALAHDRLLKESFIHAGGDLGYTINRKMSVGGAVRWFVWGKNTRNQNLFGLYMSYKML